MATPIYLVDAFSDGPFTGNPAAVVPLSGPAPDAWMQNLAMEMNQAETAYFWPEGDSYRLRWFTPEFEVKLCGHATLASAHVAWTTGIVPAEQPIYFETLSGKLICNSTHGRISMDFPAIPIGDDAETVSVDIPGWHVVRAVKNGMDVLIHLEGDKSLREFQPDMAQLGSFKGRGVIITQAVFQGEIDFESRFFAPAVGVPEDPVTGSAHCCLGPYWANFTGDPKTHWVGHQVSKRSGIVRMDLQGDRVVLAGKATTVISGQLQTNPI